MSNKKIVETDITALIPDDKNFNKGSEFGKGLLDKSFSKFGAGRSILLDKNNRIIAGNKATESFGESGGEKVLIVETDGKTLVAVKRTDIDLDSAEGRELALADNATQKADLRWDDAVVKEVSEQWGIDSEEWGVTPWVATDENLDDLFEEAEEGKDKPLKLTIEVPLNYEGNLEDIRKSVELTLEEWVGCKVK